MRHSHILAHQELFKNNILHRDISMQNINLGTPTNGTEGPHGVLLDFDMAIWADRSMEDVNKDERTVSQYSILCPLLR